MHNSQPDQISPDTALQEPSEDQLGYYDFSKNIAETITQSVPSEGSVIGIYGQWGSGKSTILNFIEYELEQRSDEVIIRFNPWWFSGQSDLMNKFFSQLEAGLETGDPSFDSVRDDLSRFAAALSRVPLESITGIPTSRAFGYISKMLEVEEPNLEEVKNEISASLREADQQIVVFIDDIDRLTEEEIKQMFRVVKSVADFPNIVYVLSFDRDIVTTALEGDRGVNDGTEYLQKIIQLPKHVPIPAENSLERFLTDRLDAIVGDDEVIFDQESWSRIYRHGIEPKIDTPRDAVRLSNSVNVSYQALKRDANYVDLIAIEFLKIHFEEIYSKIRANPERFTNRERPRQEKTVEYEEVFEDIEQADDHCAKTVISYLFPRVQVQNLGLLATTTENEETYRKRKRVCDSAIFPYYFRQTIPKGEIPAQEFESILKSAGDVSEFEEKLRELSSQEGRSGRSRANTFLKDFEEHIEDLDDYRPVVRTVFKVADDLIEVDPSQNMLDDGNEGYLVRILWNILRQIDSQERKEVLETAIESGESLYFSRHIVGVLLQEHGEMGGDKKAESERLLPYEEVEALKEVVVGEIKGAAESDKLIDSLHLDRVLMSWKDWGDESEAKDWSEEVTKDDENLIEFVGAFIREGRYSNASGSGKVEYIDPQWLEPFLDVEAVLERAQSINEDSLSEEQEEILDKLQKAEEIREEGGDPSEFTEWWLPR